MANKSKYNHLKRMFSEMLNPFEIYLKSKRYETNTIRQHLNYTAYFFNWKQRNKSEEITYSDLLMFIDHCREQGEDTRLINRKLGAIRKYYEYLQMEINDIKNPAAGLFLRGKKMGIPHDLLEMEELQELYNNYLAYDLRTTRNRVILNLLINQAVTVDDLRQLEPEHLNLEKGTIEIPNSKQIKGRILKLEASQIIELHYYLQETRPEILKSVLETSISSGRKAKNPDTERLKKQLIVSMNGSTDPRTSLYHFMKSLKQINPKVKNCGQIRQSVISYWLKTEDLRKVQYKAGHKHVSSTERYQSNNLEDLQEALEVHHPLR